MHTEPTFLQVRVEGGELAVARWGSGPNVVLAAHGITASSISWVPVVRHLDDSWTVYAPDLRGRGASSSVPGPYGIEQHALDLAAIAAHAGVERTVVAGQSMGGFIAVALADLRPDLVERLVLVDGGLPLPFALDDIDPDAVLEVTLGPALERLRMTFESVEAYVDYWRAHPALTADWHDDLDAYVRYDLTGEAPALRSRVDDEAVRADGRDLLVNGPELGEALTRIEVPVHLVRAPLGLLAQPPGVQPTELVDAWRDRISHFTEELVEGTNHYTVAFGNVGAKIIASAIASEQ